MVEPQTDAHSFARTKLFTNTYMHTHSLSVAHRTPGAYSIGPQISGPVWSHPKQIEPSKVSLHCLQWKFRVGVVSYVRLVAHKLQIIICSEFRVNQMALSIHCVAHTFTALSHTHTLSHTRTHILTVTRTHSVCSLSLSLTHAYSHSHTHTHTHTHVEAPTKELVVVVVGRVGEALAPHGGPARGEPEPTVPQAPAHQPQQHHTCSSQHRSILKQYIQISSDTLQSSEEKA